MQLPRKHKNQSNIMYHIIKTSTRDAQLTKVKHLLSHTDALRTDQSGANEKINQFVNPLQSIAASFCSELRSLKARPGLPIQLNSTQLNWPVELHR
jgi:hypothetical protein